MIKSIHFPIKMPDALRQNDTDEDAFYNATEESIKAVEKGKIINSDEFFKYLDGEIARLDKLAKK